MSCSPLYLRPLSEGTRHHIGPSVFIERLSDIRNNFNRRNEVSIMLIELLIDPMKGKKVDEGLPGSALCP